MVEVRTDRRYSRKNVTVQEIFDRGIKIRTDVIYTDPQTKKSYRLKNITGQIPTESQARAMALSRPQEPIITPEERRRIDQTYREYQVRRSNQGAKQEKSITQQQREIAKKRIGNITRISMSPKGEISYYNARGQRYTFPSTKKLTYTTPRKTIPRTNIVQKEFEKRVLRTLEKQEISKLQPTTRQQFQSVLLSKQGYRIKSEKNNLIATKGNKKLLITEDGRTIIVPMEARIETKLIPTRQQQYLRKELAKLRAKEKDLIGGFIEFPVEVYKGFVNLIKITNLTPSQVKKTNSLIATTLKVGKEAKKVKKNPTKTNIKRLNQAVKEYKAKNQTLKKGLKTNKEAVRLLTKQETILATIMIGLGGAGAVAGLVGGTTATVASVGLGTVGAVATGVQTLETIKRPTPRNFGKLAFYALPTTIGILKTIKKLSPNFRPSVKNVDSIKKVMNSQKKQNLELLRGLKKGKKLYYKNRLIKSARARKILLARNKAINQALKELNWIKKNPEIIKSRDYNPIVHTKKLKNLQGSYKTGIHVSTQPKAGNLFGQKILKLKSEKEIIKVALPKAIKPKKIADLKVFGQINKTILSTLIRNKVILGGGRGQNLQLSYLNRRLSRDFDGKVISGARKILLQLANRLNKSLKVKNRFIVRKGAHKDTYRLYDKLFKKDLVDITNVGKQKVPFVTNKQGLRIQNIKSLIKGKANALSKLERYKRKGAKDLKDLIKLTGNKVKVKDVLSKDKNPSNVFEVAQQSSGMGKSRLGFDENHMYFDFDANVAYSQGKPYSIIKFPIAKINKFPTKLRILINKASRGELLPKQGAKLRQALNRYIKANPTKFFIGPRTASLPIGEREFVLSVGSKFIKGQTYKSFDNDLKKFISIIEVDFTKPRKLSLFKIFIEGWKRKPFKTLKYRLTNPDLLTVRRYSKLIEKGFSLKKPQKLKFLSLFKKLLKKKKLVAKKGKVSLKEKISKEMKIRRKKLLAKRQKVRPVKKVKSRTTKRATTKKRTVKRTPTRTKKRATTRTPTRSTSRTTARTPIRTKKRTTTRTPTRTTTRTTTRTPTRTTTRTTTRTPTRTTTRTPTRTTTRIPARIPPPTTKPPPIITWSTKLPRGTRPLVNPIIRISGKNKELKWKLPPNKAIKKIRDLVDKTTTRSFQLKIVGITKAKDIDKVSLRKFRYRVGRDKRVLKFVEKSKYAIDTKGEKQGLSLAKKLKRR